MAQMLVKKLKLNYFGQFHNREIELKPGINLIYGDNEAGKSTVHTFIRGMLFGIERLRGRGSASKEDLYTRYLPWDYPGAFGGQMDITIKDKDYRLQRSFHASDKSFSITDLDTGREVKLKEGLISELVPGLTESAFKNTVSMEQLKAQTDSELASQVRNYIANLSIAKSQEVNVAKAVSLLTDKKKTLEAEENSSEVCLKELNSAIEEGIAREDKIDSLTIELKDLLFREQELKAEKEKLTAEYDNETGKRMEQLPAILEKYRTLRDLLSQNQPVEKQIDELTDRIGLWERECGTFNLLKEDLKEAGRINGELPELEKKRAGIEKEKEDKVNLKKYKNLSFTMIPAVMAAVLSILLIKPFVIGISLAAAAFTAGGIIFFLLNKSSSPKKKEYELKINELTKIITADNSRLNDIYQRNQAASFEMLAIKQGEITRASYALEQGREQLAQLYSRKSELDDKCDLLHDAIMKYMQHFITQEELTDDSMDRLEEAILKKRQEAEVYQADVSKRYNECTLQIGEVRGEIRTMDGNEEQLLMNKSRYKQEEKRQEKIAVELEAVKLALNTIQSLAADIHDSFGKQLNLAVSDIISRVTGSKYNDLKIDEKLDVKVGWNGEYVLFNRLSAGTIDQVYFALRLAVADLLLGREELPLILDDSFTLYDDNRIKAALKQTMDRKQTILFSCHSREKRLLEEMQLPFHYVDLSK